MYEIDPSRLDLVEEFKANPSGPHSPELCKVIDKLRTMPFPDRHVIVCTKRGKQWILAKVPPERGAKVELLHDQVFNNYYAAVWEVFKRRWETVTGQTLTV